MPGPSTRLILGSHLEYHRRLDGLTPGEENSIVSRRTKIENRQPADPAREGHEKHLKRVEVGSHPASLRARDPHGFRGLRARPSFRTLRGGQTDPRGPIRPRNLPALPPHPILPPPNPRIERSPAGKQPGHRPRQHPIDSGPTALGETGIRGSQPRSAN